MCAQYLLRSHMRTVSARALSFNFEHLLIDFKIYAFQLDTHTLRQLLLIESYFFSLYEKRVL